MIADWSEQFDSTDAEEQRIRRAEIPNSLSEFVGVGGLNALIQPAFADRGDDFRPFQIDERPEPLARFCSEVADAAGCDPSFPAIVAL